MIEVNLTSMFSSPNKGLVKTVRILEKLENGFWKVQDSSGSGTYTVFSNKKLTAGTLIKGFFRQNGNQLILEILNQESRDASPDFFYPEKTLEPGLLEKIAAVLNLKVSERESELIGKIIKKHKKGKYLIPLLIEALGKGFRTEEQLLELSLDLDGKNRKDRKKDGFKEKVKKRIKEAEKSENVLFLYNHLKVDKNNWVVFPFNFEEDLNLSGVIKMLINNDSVHAIMLNADADGREWGFYITSINSGYRMKIYCENPDNVKTSESFMKFRKKLQNLRVQIDDNVRDIVCFNGFNDENSAGVDVTV